MYYYDKGTHYTGTDLSTDRQKDRQVTLCLSRQECDQQIYRYNLQWTDMMDTQKQTDIQMDRWIAN